MEITKMGSLYFGGTPVEVGSEWDGGAITIGDTNKTKPISWVKVGNLLVADHVICTAVSWEDLNKAGFIFGRLVRINGELYLCRSMKVGDQEGIHNEWDDVLDKTGEDDSLWHWKEAFFWGQETPRGHLAVRANRGYRSAHRWNYSTASIRSVIFGFRPVLEKLLSDAMISDKVGSILKIYGPGGVTVSGELLETSEYDLILQAKAQTSGVWCSPLQDGVVVVDRSAITYTCLA